MAINLLEIVSESLGQAPGPISQALGESDAGVDAAIRLGLPAILGGLIRQSDSAAGAQTIFDMASQADAGLPDNLIESIDAGNHASVIQNGMGVLGTVFGGSNAGLVSSLSRQSGIGQGSTGSLLGILAPVVMGTVKKTMTQNNLDAGGLANMLAAQKRYLNGTLPDPLRSELGLGDLIGPKPTSVSTEATMQPGKPGTSTQAASSGTPASGTGDASQIQTPDSTPSSSGGTGSDPGDWLSHLLPVAVLGILAWLAYRYLAAG